MKLNDIVSVRREVVSHYSNKIGKVVQVPEESSRVVDINYVSFGEGEAPLAFADYELTLVEHGKEEVEEVSNVIQGPWVALWMDNENS